MIPKWKREYESAIDDMYLPCLLEELIDNAMDLGGKEGDIKSIWRIAVLKDRILKLYVSTQLRSDGEKHG